MSHSAVTLRDPVRMKLLFAALDDLDVMQCDMHSAFLSADNLERRHLTAGEQFGHDRKKTFTSVRVPHGLESVSAANWLVLLSPRSNRTGVTTDGLF